MLRKTNFKWIFILLTTQGDASVLNYIEGRQRLLGYRPNLLGCWPEDNDTFSWLNDLSLS